jgi:hypothetical protein
MHLQLDNFDKQTTITTTTKPINLQYRQEQQQAPLEQ